MKQKSEITLIAIMLVICLLFAACAQKAEEKLTDKATDPKLISSTTQSQTVTEGENEDEDDETIPDDKKAKETTDDSSITADEALEELSYFYGSLYTVEKSGEAKGKADYIVKDNNGKEYAKVSVNLADGYATETVTGTGEVNTVNLLV